MNPARSFLSLLLVASHGFSQAPTFGLTINGLAPTGEFARSASGTSPIADTPPPEERFTPGVEFHLWISRPLARVFALRPGLSLSQVDGSYGGPGVLGLDLEETSFCLKVDALLFPWGGAREFRGTYLFAGLGLDHDKVSKSPDQLHIFDRGVDTFQPQDALRPGATLGFGHASNRVTRRGAHWIWELGYHTTLDSRSAADPPRTRAFKAGFGLVF
jgi:hypothetical protein